MRTPAGSECRYFYGNYYRGKVHEECRLLSHPTSPSLWSPDLCKTCPVPGILLANACEHMNMNAQITRSFSTGLKRKVLVSSYCEKTQRKVTHPEIGCGECHPAPFTIEEKK